jgi:restriction system protein
MAPNSLFAVLLRSPWWYSLGIAAAFVAVMRFALPREYFLFGALGALPFVVIGCLAAWRQLRAPSAKKVAGTLQTLQTMAWREFAATLEEAFVKDGYAVERLNTPAADFMLTKSSRISLVSAKRWKAASVGVQALRELRSAGDQREAQECIYATLSDVSDNAGKFAKDNSIRMLQAAELAVMLQTR